MCSAITIATCFSFFHGNEYGFLHDAFEGFVVEHWKGLSLERVALNPEQEIELVLRVLSTRPTDEEIFHLEHEDVNPRKAEQEPEEKPEEEPEQEPEAGTRVLSPQARWPLRKSAAWAQVVRTGRAGCARPPICLSCCRTPADRAYEKYGKPRPAWEKNLGVAGVPAQVGGHFGSRPE
jgi:hypothetical protein